MELYVEHSVTADLPTWDSYCVVGVGPTLVCPNPPPPVIQVSAINVAQKNRHGPVRTIRSSANEFADELRGRNTPTEIVVEEIVDGVVIIKKFIEIEVKHYVTEDSFDLDSLSPCSADRHFDFGSDNDDYKSLINEMKYRLEEVLGVPGEPGSTILTPEEAISYLQLDTLPVCTDSKSNSYSNGVPSAVYDSLSDDVFETDPDLSVSTKDVSVNISLHKSAVNDAEDGGGNIRKFSIPSIKSFESDMTNLTISSEGSSFALWALFGSENGVDRTEQFIHITRSDSFDYKNGQTKALDAEYDDDLDSETAGNNGTSSNGRRAALDKNDVVKKENSDDRKNVDMLNINCLKAESLSNEKGHNRHWGNNFEDLSKPKSVSNLSNQTNELNQNNSGRQVVNGSSLPKDESDDSVSVSVDLEICVRVSLNEETTSQKDVMGKNDNNADNFGNGMGTVAAVTDPCVLIAREIVAKVLEASRPLVAQSTDRALKERREKPYLSLCTIDGSDLRNDRELVLGRRSSGASIESENKEADLDIDESQSEGFFEQSADWDGQSDVVSYRELYGIHNDISAQASVEKIPDDENEQDNCENVKGSTESCKNDIGTLNKTSDSVVDFEKFQNDLFYQREMTSEGNLMHSSNVDICDENDADSSFNDIYYVAPLALIQNTSDNMETRFQIEDDSKQHDDICTNTAGISILSTVIEESEGNSTVDSATIRYEYSGDNVECSGTNQGMSVQIRHQNYKYDDDVEVLAVIINRDNENQLEDNVSHEECSVDEVEKILNDLIEEISMNVGEGSDDPNAMAIIVDDQYGNGNPAIEYIELQEPDNFDVNVLLNEMLEKVTKDLSSDVENDEGNSLQPVALIIDDKSFKGDKSQLSTMTDIKPHQDMDMVVVAKQDSEESDIGLDDSRCLEDSSDDYITCVSSEEDYNYPASDGDDNVDNQKPQEKSDDTNKGCTGMSLNKEPINDNKELKLDELDKQVAENDAEILMTDHYNDYSLNNMIDGECPHDIKDENSAGTSILEDEGEEGGNLVQEAEEMKNALESHDVDSSVVIGLKDDDGLCLKYESEIHVNVDMAKDTSMKSELLKDKHVENDAPSEPETCCIKPIINMNEDVNDEEKKITQEDNGQCKMAPSDKNENEIPDDILELNTGISNLGEITEVTCKDEKDLNFSNVCTDAIGILKTNEPAGITVPTLDDHVINDAEEDNCIPTSAIRSKEELEGFTPKKDYTAPYDKTSTVEDILERESGNADNEIHEGTNEECVRGVGISHDATAQQTDVTISTDDCQVYSDLKEHHIAGRDLEISHGLTMDNVYNTNDSPSVTVAESTSYEAIHTLLEDNLEQTSDVNIKAPTNENLEDMKEFTSEQEVTVSCDNEPSAEDGNSSIENIEQNTIVTVSNNLSGDEILNETNGVNTRVVATSFSFDEASKDAITRNDNQEHSDPKETNIDDTNLKFSAGPFVRNVCIFRTNNCPGIIVPVNLSNDDAIHNLPEDNLGQTSAIINVIPNDNRAEEIEESPAEHGDTVPCDTTTSAEVASSIQEDICDQNIHTKASNRSGKDFQEGRDSSTDQGEGFSDVNDHTNEDLESSNAHADDKTCIIKTNAPTPIAVTVPAFDENGFHNLQTDKTSETNNKLPTDTNLKDMEEFTPEHKDTVPCNTVPSAEFENRTADNIDEQKTCDNARSCLSDNKILDVINDDSARGDTISQESTVILSPDQHKGSSDLKELNEGRDTEYNGQTEDDMCIIKTNASSGVNVSVTASDDDVIHELDEDKPNQTSESNNQAFNDKNQQDIDKLTPEQEDTVSPEEEHHTCEEIPKTINEEKAVGFATLHHSNDNSKVAFTCDQNQTDGDKEEHILEDKNLAISDARSMDNGCNIKLNNSPVVSVPVSASDKTTHKLHENNFEQTTETNVHISSTVEPEDIDESTAEREDTVPCDVPPSAQDDDKIQENVLEEKTLVTVSIDFSDNEIPEGTFNETVSNDQSDNASKVASSDQSHQYSDLNESRKEAPCNENPDKLRKDGSLPYSTSISEANDNRSSEDQNAHVKVEISGGTLDDNARDVSIFPDPTEKESRQTLSTSNNEGLSELIEHNEKDTGFQFSKDHNVDNIETVETDDSAVETMLTSSSDDDVINNMGEKSLDQTFEINRMALNNENVEEKTEQKDNDVCNMVSSVDSAAGAEKGISEDIHEGNEILETNNNDVTDFEISHDSTVTLTTEQRHRNSEESESGKEFSKDVTVDNGCIVITGDSPGGIVPVNESVDDANVEIYEDVGNERSDINDIGSSKGNLEVTGKLTPEMEDTVVCNIVLSAMDENITQDDNMEQHTSIKVNNNLSDKEILEENSEECAIVAETKVSEENPTANNYSEEEAECVKSVISDEPALEKVIDEYNASNDGDETENKEDSDLTEDHGYVVDIINVVRGLKTVESFENSEFQSDGNDNISAEVEGSECNNAQEFGRALQENNLDQISVINDKDNDLNDSGDHLDGEVRNTKEHREEKEVDKKEVAGNEKSFGGECDVPCELLNEEDNDCETNMPEAELPNKSAFSGIYMNGKEGDIADNVAKHQDNTKCTDGNGIADDKHVLDNVQSSNTSKSYKDIDSHNEDTVNEVSAPVSVSDEERREEHIQLSTDSESGKGEGVKSCNEMTVDSIEAEIENNDDDCSILLSEERSFGFLEERPSFETSKNAESIDSINESVSDESTESCNDGSKEVKETFSDVFGVEDDWNKENICIQSSIPDVSSVENNAANATVHTRVDNKDLDVEVDNKKSDVEVDNKVSDVEVDYKDSDVEVDNKDSDVEVDNKDSDVEVDNEVSDVEMDNKVSDVEVDNKDSDVEVDNKESNVEVDNKDSDVEVDNKDSDVDCNEMKIEGADLVPTEDLSNLEEKHIIAKEIVESEIAKYNHGKQNCGPSNIKMIDSTFVFSSHQLIIVISEEVTDSVTILKDKKRKTSKVSFEEDVGLHFIKAVCDNNTSNTGGKPASTHNDSKSKTKQKVSKNDEDHEILATSAAESLGENIKNISQEEKDRVVTSEHNELNDDGEAAAIRDIEFLEVDELAKVDNTFENPNLIPAEKQNLEDGIISAELNNGCCKESALNTANDEETAQKSVKFDALQDQTISQEEVDDTTGVNQSKDCIRPQNNSLIRHVEASIMNDSEIFEEKETLESSAPEKCCSSSILVDDESSEYGVVLEETEKGNNVTENSNVDMYSNSELPIDVSSQRDTINDQSSDQGFINEESQVETTDQGYSDTETLNNKNQNEANMQKESSVDQAFERKPETEHIACDKNKGEGKRTTDHDLIENVGPISNSKKGGEIHDANDGNMEDISMQCKMNTVEETQLEVGIDASDTSHKCDTLCENALQSEIELIGDTQHSEKVSKSKQSDSGDKEPEATDIKCHSTDQNASGRNIGHVALDIVCDDEMDKIESEMELREDKEVGVVKDIECSVGTNVVESRFENKQDTLCDVPSIEKCLSKDELDVNVTNKANIKGSIANDAQEQSVLIENTDGNDFKSDSLVEDTSLHNTKVSDYRVEHSIEKSKCETIGGNIDNNLTVNVNDFCAHHDSEGPNSNLEVDQTLPEISGHDLGMQGNTTTEEHTCMNMDKTEDVVCNENIANKDDTVSSQSVIQTTSFEQETDTISDIDVWNASKSGSQMRHNTNKLRRGKSFIVSDSNVKFSGLQRKPSLSQIKVYKAVEINSEDDTSFHELDPELKDVEEHAVNDTVGKSLTPQNAVDEGLHYSSDDVYAESNVHVDTDSPSSNCAGETNSKVLLPQCAIDQGMGGVNDVALNEACNEVIDEQYKDNNCSEVSSADFQYEHTKVDFTSTNDCEEINKDATSTTVDVNSDVLNEFDLPDAKNETDGSLLQNTLGNNTDSEFCESTADEELLHDIPSDRKAFDEIAKDEMSDENNSSAQNVQEMAQCSDVGSEITCNDANDDLEHDEQDLNEMNKNLTLIDSKIDKTLYGDGSDELDSATNNTNTSANSIPVNDRSVESEMPYDAGQSYEGCVNEVEIAKPLQSFHESEQDKESSHAKNSNVIGVNNFEASHVEFDETNGQNLENHIVPCSEIENACDFESQTTPDLEIDAAVNEVEASCVNDTITKSINVLKTHESEHDVIEDMKETKIDDLNENMCGAEEVKAVDVSDNEDLKEETIEGGQSNMLEDNTLEHNQNALESDQTSAECTHKIDVVPSEEGAVGGINIENDDTINVSENEPIATEQNDNRFVGNLSTETVNYGEPKENDQKLLKSSVEVEQEKDAFQSTLEMGSSSVERKDVVESNSSDLTSDCEQELQENYELKHDKFETSNDVAMCETDAAAVDVKMEHTVKEDTDGTATENNNVAVDACLMDSCVQRNDEYEKEVLEKIVDTENTTTDNGKETELVEACYQTTDGSEQEVSRHLDEAENTTIQNESEIKIMEPCVQKTDEFEQDVSVKHDEAEITTTDNGREIGTVKPCVQKTDESEIKDTENVDDNENSTTNNSSEIEVVDPEVSEKIDDSRNPAFNSGSQDGKAEPCVLKTDESEKEVSEKIEDTENTITDNGSETKLLEPTSQKTDDSEIEVLEKVDDNENTTVNNESETELVDPCIQKSDGSDPDVSEKVVDTKHETTDNGSETELVVPCVQKTDGPDPEVSEKLDASENTTSDNGNEIESLESHVQKTYESENEVSEKMDDSENTSANSASEIALVESYIQKTDESEKEVSETVDDAENQTTDNGSETKLVEQCVLKADKSEKEVSETVEDAENKTADKESETEELEPNVHKTDKTEKVVLENVDNTANTTTDTGSENDGVELCVQKADESEKEASEKVDDTENTTADNGSEIHVLESCVQKADKSEQEASKKVEDTENTTTDNGSEIDVVESCVQKADEIEKEASEKVDDTERTSPDNGREIVFEDKGDVEQAICEITASPKNPERKHTESIIPDEPVQNESMSETNYIQHSQLNENDLADSGKIVCSESVSCADIEPKCTTEVEIAPGRVNVSSIDNPVEVTLQANDISDKANVTEMDNVPYSDHTSIDKPETKITIDKDVAEDTTETAKDNNSNLTDVVYPVKSDAKDHNFIENPADTNAKGNEDQDLEANNKLTSSQVDTSTNDEISQNSLKATDARSDELQQESGNSECISNSLNNENDTECPSNDKPSFAGNLENPESKCTETPKNNDEKVEIGITSSPNVESKNKGITEPSEIHSLPEKGNSAMAPVVSPSLLERESEMITDVPPKMPLKMKEGNRVESQPYNRNTFQVVADVHYSMDKDDEKPRFSVSKTSSDMVDTVYESDVKGKTKENLSQKKSASTNKNSVSDDLIESIEHEKSVHIVRRSAKDASSPDCSVSFKAKDSDDTMTGVHSNKVDANSLNGKHDDRRSQCSATSTLPHNSETIEANKCDTKHTIDHTPKSEIPKSNHHQTGQDLRSKSLSDVLSCTRVAPEGIEGALSAKNRTASLGNLMQHKTLTEFDCRKQFFERRGRVSGESQDFSAENFREKERKAFDNGSGLRTDEGNALDARDGNAANRALQEEGQDISQNFQSDNYRRSIDHAHIMDMNELTVVDIDMEGGEYDEEVGCVDPDDLSNKLKKWLADRRRSSLQGETERFIKEAFPDDICPTPRRMHRLCEQIKKESKKRDMFIKQRNESLESTGAAKDLTLRRYGSAQRSLECLDRDGTMARRSREGSRRPSIERRSSRGSISPLESPHASPYESCEDLRFKCRKPDYIEVRKLNSEGRKKKADFLMNAHLKTFAKPKPIVDENYGPYELIKVRKGLPRDNNFDRQYALAKRRGLYPQIKVAEQAKQVEYEVYRYDREFRQNANQNVQTYVESQYLNINQIYDQCKSVKHGNLRQKYDHSQITNKRGQIMDTASRDQYEQPIHDQYQKNRCAKKQASSLTTKVVTLSSNQDNGRQFYRSNLEHIHDRTKHQHLQGHRDPKGGSNGPQDIQKMRIPLDREISPKDGPLSLADSFTAMDRSHSHDSQSTVGSHSHSNAGSHSFAGSHAGNQSIKHAIASKLDSHDSSSPNLSHVSKMSGNNILSGNNLSSHHMSGNSLSHDLASKLDIHNASNQSLSQELASKLDIADSSTHSLAGQINNRLSTHRSSSSGHNMSGQHLSQELASKLDIADSSGHSLDRLQNLSTHSVGKESLSHELAAKLDIQSSSQNLSGKLSDSQTSLSSRQAPSRSPSRQNTLLKQHSVQSSLSELNGERKDPYIGGIKFERLKNLEEDELLAKIREIIGHLERLEDYHRGDGMRIQKMLGDMYWDYTHMREMIADCMAENGYAIVAMKMLKTLNSIGIFKNDDVWFPTYYTYNTMWNFSDASPILAKKLSENDAVRLLSLNCGHKPYINALHSKNVFYVIKASLSILHNIARNSGMKHLFDENKTSETVMPFIESEDEMLKILASLTIANIVDEEENKTIIVETRTIHNIVGWIDKAINLPRRRYKGFTPQELTEGLNKLAVNDSNKMKIVEEGGVPLILKMLQNEDVREQSSAARIIWTLSFDKEVRDTFLANSDLITTLEKLVETTNKSVQQNASGSLWIIKGENDISRETKAANNPDAPYRPKPPATKSHIFLSYSWSDKEEVLELRDKLRAEGYAMWIDIEKDSTLDGMAHAVENSAVVLICMSEKYKQNPNCRTEAEYTFQMKKEYIPIMMQKKYRPDGWLGVILGAKLYFDFSGKYPFDKSFTGLLKELRGRGKVTPNNTPNGNDVTDGGMQSHMLALTGARGSFQGPGAVVPSNSIIMNMGQEELIKWLRNVKLTECIPAFLEFDGKLLMQLKQMRVEAPEFFYQCLEKRLNMSLIEILKFTRALEELH